MESARHSKIRLRVPSPFVNSDKQTRSGHHLKFKVLHSAIYVVAEDRSCSVSGFPSSVRFRDDGLCGVDAEMIRVELLERVHGVGRTDKVYRRCFLFLSVDFEVSKQSFISETSSQLKVAHVVGPPYVVSTCFIVSICVFDDHSGRHQFIDDVGHVSSLWLHAVSI